MKRRVLLPPLPMWLMVLATATASGRDDRMERTLARSPLMQDSYEIKIGVGFFFHAMKPQLENQQRIIITCRHLTISCLASSCLSAASLRIWKMENLT